MLNEKNILVVLLMSVALSVPCLAGPVFDFHYTDFSGSLSTVGTLSTNALGGGVFQVVGITGSWDLFGVQSTITGLIGPGGFGGNDNLLSYPTEPFVDFNGISFLVAGSGDDGFGDANIYFDPDYGYLESGDVLATFNVTLQDSPADSSAPEPSTILLLPLGLGGLMALPKRIRRMPS